jgi:exopolysaccharide biosynthesis polyprenyl glycosylphosphotransferase
LIETALKTREVAVLGVFDDRLGRAPKEIAGVPVLGDTGDLLGHKVLPYVDRIVIAVNPTAQNRVREIIARLRVLPNDVSLVLDSGEDGRVRALSRIADAQLAQVSGEPADVRRAVVKRLQDIVIGWTALILGLPVMALVAIAIKLDSPGPIFFRQRRHGFNNEEILVWKFRSMRQEAADFAAVQQVQAGDDRVTRVGRFIRKTSLDELPQLFNVIGGEMSLVGPRPHAVGMKTGQTESARLVAEYAHRHRMKPGMTGWAAINGSRGPVDSPELVRRRVALDIEYIERQSFWFDIYIMAMTIPCLLGDSETVR